MMSHKYTYIFLALALCLGSAPALACDAAGANKHVGMITAVDDQAGTFTIMDAQTNQPITFAAPKAVLGKAARTKGPATVSYREEKGGLVAEDVR